MEGDIDQLGSLLHYSVVWRILFDLLLLLLDIIVGPNVIVLHINVVDQHVVQGDLTLRSVFQSKVMVFIRKFLLSLVEGVVVRVIIFLI